MYEQVYLLFLYKVKEEEGGPVDPDQGMDRDVLINSRYDNAVATAGQFLTVFLKKCGSKSEETDFRPLFENFLQDLLVTVNTAEWPAAELLLSLLGKLLVSQFANKGNGWGGTRDGIGDRGVAEGGRENIISVIYLNVK